MQQMESDIQQTRSEEMNCMNESDWQMVCGKKRDIIIKKYIHKTGEPIRTPVVEIENVFKDGENAGILNGIREDKKIINLI